MTVILDLDKLNSRSGVVKKEHARAHRMQPEQRSWSIRISADIPKPPSTNPIGNYNTGSTPQSQYLIIP